MKQLIVCLVFIGLSGNAIAQVSCDGIVPADEPCVCDFVMDTMAMENDTGVAYDSTEIFKSQGNYSARVNFACSDSIQNVTIVFTGGNQKTCRVTKGTTAQQFCVQLPDHPVYHDYKGKKLKAAKQVLQEYMDAAGY